MFSCILFTSPLLSFLKLFNNIKAFLKEGFYIYEKESIVIKPISITKFMQL